ncbi:MAG: anthranilate synthase component I [Eubacteriales bacterium]|nr:anthranilate synthase component I [Eubacteriales bacterium]
MMYPDYEEFQGMARAARMIPVSEELFLDTQTPIGLFLRFSEMENSFLLESVEGGERWARYSYIGRRPFMVFKSSGDDMTIIKGNETVYKKGNPFDELKSLLKEYKGVHIKGMPRFCGGAVGYIGYDMVRHIEYLPGMPRDDVGLPDSYLCFYDEVITYDHLKQRVVITVNADTGGGIEKAYALAKQRIAETNAELCAVFESDKNTKPSPSEIKLESTFSKEGYMAAVRRAKTYIQDGDIFQVVLSQRLSAKAKTDPLAVYRVLRTLNPSPYMYYLKFGDAVIVGSSPELLVRVEDGIVETCPIAGTCPRGKDNAEDDRLSHGLLQDEKEMAEHTMLVDLGRNDIGRVSKFGTVNVINPMHVEKYSHVMHIVSNVTGEMEEGRDSFDALRAILPAGTLSGAPKVRAMQIIDELEPLKRGIYGGCVGYIGFDGNMDTCITIRTIVFHDGRVYIQAGAGIVADSVPEKEFFETLNKGQALFSALKKAGDMA